MTDQTPIGNSFRRALLSGERRKLVLDEKQPRLEHREPAPGDEGDDASLTAGIIPRGERRHSDHREGDRHRLTDETAIVRYRGNKYTVELINLSGGGAKISAEFEPRLWDIVELQLGDGPGIECAVRWLRDGRAGLEFAHETRIDCDPKTRARLLLDTIQRSFPNLDIDIDLPEQPDRAQPAPENSQEDPGNRGEARHPLVWSGQILFAFDTNPVRLRNISVGGALVDVSTKYPVGSEVMLDLGDAGQFDAIVSWAKGEQAGLRFKQPFDLDCLARLRPDVTPHRWRKPDFLKSGAEEGSAWDEEWSRLSLSELQAKLEGFLKH